VRFVVDDGDTGVSENIDTTVNVIAFNNDGGLSAASGVSEPAGLSTDRDTSAEALEVFDFTLTDGAGGDGAEMGRRLVWERLVSMCRARAPIRIARGLRGC
jgi:hypothetical protein